MNSTAPERPKSLHTMRLFKGSLDCGRDEPMLVASVANAYMDMLEAENELLRKACNLGIQGASEHERTDSICHHRG